MKKLQVITGCIIIITQQKTEGAKGQSIIICCAGRHRRIAYIYILYNIKIFPPPPIYIVNHAFYAIKARRGWLCCSRGFSTTTTMVILLGFGSRKTKKLKNQPPRIKIENKFSRLRRRRNSNRKPNRIIHTIIVHHLRRVIINYHSLHII